MCVWGGLLKAAYVGPAEEEGGRPTPWVQPTSGPAPHIHACYVRRPVLGRKRCQFLKWRRKVGMELKGKVFKGIHLLLPSVNDPHL